MADLTGIQAAQTVKVVGNDQTGAEQVPVESILDNEGKGRLLADVRVRPGEMVPTITNKLRMRTNAGVVTNLPASNAYQTLYTRSGTGLFFGFQVGFNSDKVNVRFTIDGGQVFTLSLVEIRTFQFNDTSTTRCQAGSWLTTVGNILDFSSRFAIPYDTSFLIEAASNDSVLHTCRTWISIHTEDT